MMSALCSLQEAPTRQDSEVDSAVLQWKQLMQKLLVVLDRPTLTKSTAENDQLNELQTSDPAAARCVVVGTEHHFLSVLADCDWLFDLHCAPHCETLRSIDYIQIIWDFNMPVSMSDVANETHFCNSAVCVFSETKLSAPAPVCFQSRDGESSFEVPVRAGPLQTGRSRPRTPSHAETQTRTLQDGSRVRQHPRDSAQVCSELEIHLLGLQGAVLCVWKFCFRFLYLHR